MEPNTNELNKKVQQCETEILKVIDSICRKYRLRYFAIGGTALGAMRHEGFIPWDDDIDIGMPRKDYERLLKILPDELPDGYHIQNFFTEPNTPFYFTKIRKDNTLFVEYYLKDYDIHHGIFVDIFPFDNVPRNPKIRNVHFYVSRVLYQLFLAKSLKTVCSSRLKQKNTKKIIIRKTLHYLMAPIPKAWLFHALDRWVQLFNHKKADEISHIMRRRLRAKLSELYPLTRLKFEDMKIAVPHDCDAYLRDQFGDWEKLPPEDKRYGHLPYLVEFDVEEGNKYGYRVYSRGL